MSLLQSCSSGRGFPQIHSEPMRNGEAEYSERAEAVSSRQVKIHYPEFGEDGRRVRGQKWSNTLIKAALTAAVIMGGIAIGFSIGSLPGAVIALGVSAMSLGGLSLATLVYDKVTRARFLAVLPTQGQHQIYSDHDDCKVGKYYNANVRLASTADEGFEWKKSLIESAQESIELSANYAGGSSYREILQLIDARMSQNVQLKAHLIVSCDFLESLDIAEHERLKEKFGDRFQLLVTDRRFNFDGKVISTENHVKMLIVDGRYFVAGGTSTHPRLASERFASEKPGQNDVQETPTLAARTLELSARDMDIVGESQQLAHVMRKQFFNLYRIYEIHSQNSTHSGGMILRNRFFELQEAAGQCARFEAEEGRIDDVRMKFIVSGPEHRGNNAITQQYAKRIRKAQREIKLANWMFNPPKPVLRALKSAKLDQNKTVTAYVNDTGKLSCKNFITYGIVSRPHYGIVDKVYEYNVPDQVFHKKVATFDDSHTIIGSYNFNTKSHKHDHEVAFVIKDPRVTALCKEVLAEDQARSVEFTQNQVEQQHVIAKVFSSLFTPLIEIVL